MSVEILSAIAVFAVVSSITPGPNNTMLLASGVNFGFFRTLPHMLGVTIGFSFMILAVGVGLSAIFVAYPPLHDVLFVLSSLYLIYLAWSIASSGSMSDSEKSTAKPFTFLQSAAFQWVNPKAWAMALGASTNYVTPDNFVAGLLTVSVVFAVVNFPCISLWAGCGAALKHYLANDGHRRLFNYSLAALLVISVLMSAYEKYLAK